MPSLPVCCIDTSLILHFLGTSISTSFTTLCGNCLYNWCKCLLTLGAHAQRGLRYLVYPSVCVCVCLSLAIFALEAMKRYRSDTKSISASSALNFFPETTALKSYGVKTSEKANMLIGQYVCTGLPRLLLVQFRHRGGIRSYTPSESSVASNGKTTAFERNQKDGS